jgi:hypothetical protein
MEELFQLIIALFIISFPLLSALTRRRQARRARKRREKAAAEAQPASRQATGMEPVRGRAGDEGEGGRPESEEAPRRARNLWRRQRREARDTEGWGSHYRRFGRGRETARGEGEPVRQDERRAAPAGGTVGGGPERRGVAPAQTGPDGTTRAAADSRPRVSGTRRAGGLDRIERLPRLQQAVVWAEILGRPKALRRGPEPRDE